MADARWYWGVLLISFPATLFWVAAAHWGGPYGSLVPLLPIVALIGGMLIVSASFRQNVLLAFLVVNLTLLNYRVRDEDAEMQAATHGGGPNWQNYVKLLIWLCLVLICVVEWRKIVRYWHDLPLGALAAMIAIYVVSGSWSPDPVLTIASAFGLVAYLLFGTLVAVRVPTDVLIRTIIWSIAAWCIASWLYLGVSPSEAIGDWRYQGMSGHPNELAGQVVAMLCLLFGAYQRSYITRRAFHACLILGLVTLAATQSRTSTIGFVIALGLLKYRRATITIGLIVMVIVTVLYMSGLMDQLRELFVRSGDGDMLAGRTDLWAYFAKKMAERPIIGYGFNTFERYSMVDTNYNPLMRLNAVAGHPHNNIFEVLFSGGIVGLTPYLVWAFAFLHRWWKKPDILLDLYGLALLIGSFTETNVTAPAHLGSLALIILLAIDSRYGRSPVRTEASHDTVDRGISNPWAWHGAGGTTRRPSGQPQIDLLG